MSDDLIPVAAELDEGFDDEEEYEDEYEEISSDEVDRVISVLEELMDSVESENIRVYLEDAVNSIFYLVYEDEEEAADGDEPLAEAA